MSIEAPPTGSDSGAGAAITLSMQAVYLKDCSYEAPNGPRVDGNWNPQINLDLHTAANGLTPELREVVGPCARRDARRVLDLVAAHRAALLEAWRRFHG